MYPTTVGGRCVAALAMLMGVLVIAFPVSVFSDLWSNELKQRGVDYEDIIMDDEDDDNESAMSPSDQKNGISRSVRFSDEVSELSASARLDGISPSLLISERTQQSSIPEDGVVLDAEDVAALTKHMRIMDKSHERIRGILAKYDIET